MEQPRKLMFVFVSFGLFIVGFQLWQGRFFFTSSATCADTVCILSFHNLRSTPERPLFDLRFQKFILATLSNAADEYARFSWFSLS